MVKRPIRKKLLFNIIISLILVLFITRPLLAAEYKLHIDDQLQISVWGHSDLTSEVIVGPDGSINLPLIGSVQAQGLTVDELTKVLIGKYQEYVKKPQVNILLKKYRKMTVMVLGEVKQPGTYQLEGSKRILEVISRAGGPTEIAALGRVKLTRGEKSMALDLKALLEGEGMVTNYEIEDGDVIFIPKGVIEVTINGQVKSPGSYQIKEDMGPGDLLAIAGGLTDIAALDRVRLSRDEGTTVLDWEALLEGRTSSKEYQLKDGDVIFIPEAIIEITIDGQVKNPGSYKIKEDMGAGDLLAIAGGVTDIAALNRVRLSRNNKTSILDWEAQLEGRVSTDSYQPVAGDIIYIPKGTIEVTIDGQVKKPGRYQLKEDMGPADLLAIAGGITDIATLEKVKLTRGNNIQTLDLRALLEGRDSSIEYQLEDGDNIYIPEGVIEVTIDGEVRKPGRYQLKEDMAPGDLLAIAGGVTEIAALDKVRLSRGDKTETLDLQALLEGRAETDSYQLEDGDVLHIPKGAIEVTISGEVKNPGRYQLKEDMGLAELLAMAGGPSVKAGQLVEYTSANKMESISLEDIVASSPGLPDLKEGDLIYIPEGEVEVTILGEVKRPGTYPWNKNLKLSDLLARAGNQTEYGNLKEIKVIHGDNSTKYYNLKQYFDKGSKEDNPVLLPGDSVYVLKGDYEVTILGEVNKPGTYPWQEKMRLTDLMARAGNQTTSGDITEVKISHQNQAASFVNLKKYFEDGNDEHNPPIMPGDTVYIEKENYEVSVLGEVNRPGNYQWHQQLRLDSLLAKAGNQTERGDIKNIKILHADGSSEKINLEKYLNSEKGAKNPQLKPGDTIKIEETKSINWQQVFAFVAGLKLIKDFLEINW